MHRRAVRVSDPNAGREFRRIAERPVVTEIRTGAGFAGDWKFKAQRRFGAKGEQPRIVVAEDVREEVSSGWVGDADGICGGTKLTGGRRFQHAVRTIFVGVEYQVVPFRWCKNSKSSCKTGAAPVTPETSCIGEPSELPTQTPMVNSGV